MELINYKDFLLFIPHFFLSTSILLILIFGVSFKKRILDSIIHLSILCLLITLILTLHNQFYSSLIFNGLFQISHNTYTISTIILISSISVLLISIDSLKNQRINSFEYPILILLTILGLLFLISSADLLTMYLAIELQSLASYILAAYKRDSQYSTEAGLKYFFLGALSSGFLLFGCSLIYGLTGTTNFESLNHWFLHSQYSIGLNLSLLFIAIGLLFKLAAAPFHFWLPDVYHGSLDSVVAFFAIVPKISILTLFLDLFFESFYGLIDYSQQILFFSSILSILIGSITSLVQSVFKRLLAYSAIAHIGYMLISFTGESDGIQALFIYMILYIIMSIAIFSILLANKKDLLYLHDFSGLATYNPLLGFTISIILFSMAGIPPLAGFFSKYFVFLAAFKSGIYLLPLIGIVTSTIATFYYIRIVKNMYFITPSTNHLSFSFYITNTYILGLCLFIILFFILNPSFLLILTHSLIYTYSL